MPREGLSRPKVRAVHRRVGSAYSLPEYGRLTALFAQRSENDPEAHRRLVRAAWVNRVELVVVLFEIVTGVLASA